MENEKLIKKWLENSLSETEKEQFKNTKDHKSLNRLSNALTSFKSDKFPIEQELKRFAYSGNSEEKKSVALPWLNPFLRIAASFVVIATIGYFIYNTNFLNSFGETIASGKSELYLPDSSLVALNANSTLTYSTKKWNKQRKVSLQGEAFFKVAKGSKFDVETNSGIISVLGTEFNVKNRANYFEVVCYEGNVQVTTSQKVIQLGAHQLVRIIDEKLMEEAVSANDSPSWLNGESSFNSVPLKLVLKEFERQYKVIIKADGIELNQLFTGGFAYNNINVALESVTAPVNLSYQIKSDTVIIVRAIQ